MKNLIVALIMTLSSTLALAGQFDQICKDLGEKGVCSSATFCTEVVYPAGCYLARGEAAYQAILCKNAQQDETLCRMLQDQGHCVWVEQARAKCVANQ